jgi:hypothetical protein
MEDKKLLKWVIILLLAPLVLAYFSNGDRFRYPCQNPDNWDNQICKLPTCDVTRTCPEHIFKGQRDPRLGPPKDEPTNTISSPPVAPNKQGVSCGK